MPTGYSGVDSQLGIGQETTFGTVATPTVFIPFDSESFNLAQSYYESTALRSGRLAQDAGLTVATTREVAGGFSHPFFNKGMGKLLDLLTPGTVTPVVNTGIAYDATFPVGLGFPQKSLTVQIGRPAVTGTIYPFTYTGTKVTGATFSCAVGGALDAAWTAISQDEQTSASAVVGPALATASYTAGLVPLIFNGGSVTVNSTPVATVTSASVTVGVPQSLRHYMNNTALGLQGVAEAYLTVDASITVDFYDLALQTLFYNAGVANTVLDFTGAVITGAVKEEAKFTIPNGQVRGDSPNVGGPSILTQTVPIKGLSSGATAPLTIKTTSIDTTL